jgi:hypothetical protein
MVKEDNAKTEETADNDNKDSTNDSINNSDEVLQGNTIEEIIKRDEEKGLKGGGKDSSSQGGEEKGLKGGGKRNIIDKKKVIHAEGKKGDNIPDSLK